MPTIRKKRKHVAVVDDHLFLRTTVSGLVSSIINSDDDNLFDVTIEAENGQDFTEKILNVTEPIDIVILDINMPKMDGFDTLKWINTHYPKIKVLILTMYNDPAIVSSFMKEGAAGYLTKDVSAEKIQTAIKSIALEGFFYDAFITNSLIETLKRNNYTAGEYQYKVKSTEKILTIREIEFLKLASTELSYKDIADKMQVSSRTVEGYREDLFRKLEVKSRVGLVMYAIKNGLHK